jgi:phospholipase/carboxylesterase
MLAKRAGPAPRVSHGMPHEQLDQNAPSAMQEALFARAAQLPDVEVGRSHVSVPGARAFHLDPAVARGGPGSTMVGTEFAHLHPAYDGSLHAQLPDALASEAIAQGWAELHPIAKLRGVNGLVMIYGPRDPEELEVVWSLVLAAYASARGDA